MKLFLVILFCWFWINLVVWHDNKYIWKPLKEWIDEHRNNITEE